jgi:hypothetical protein
MVAFEIAIDAKVFLNVRGVLLVCIFENYTPVPISASSFRLGNFIPPAVWTESSSEVENVQKGTWS